MQTLAVADEEGLNYTQLGPMDYQKTGERGQALLGGWHESSSTD